MNRKKFKETVNVFDMIHISKYLFFIENNQKKSMEVLDERDVQLMYYGKYLGTFINHALYAKLFSSLNL
jgi:hypothetical protein